MKSYASGSSITIDVGLSHEDGSSIEDASSVLYTLYDENDVVLINEVALSTFIYGDVTASIVIPGSHNVLGLGRVINSRRLLVKVTTALGDIVYFNEIYIINGSSSLTYMVNSYQTIQEAELNAFTMPNIDYFNASTLSEKTAALIEAFNHLGMVTYSIDYNYLGGTVDYITEFNTGASGTPMSQFGRRSVVVDKLNLLPLAYISMLPSVFLTKLKIAQVLEANNILGGEDERGISITSEKIGESTTSWRQTKPISLPVSRKALESLTGYLYYGSKLGRG